MGAITAARAIGARPEQQDEICLIRHRYCHIVVLADGMGGTRGGGEAARAAVEAVRRSTARLKIADFAGAERAGRIALRAAISAVEPLSGGTTLIIAFVWNRSRAHVVGVGDSRAWYVWQGAVVDALPQHEHHLTGGLLSSIPVASLVSATSIAENGALIIATDGWTPLRHDIAAAAHTTAREIVKRQIDQGVKGQDNVAVVVVPLDGDVWFHEDGVVEVLPDLDAGITP